MHLRENFDMAGQREYRPGRLAKNKVGDDVRLRQKSIAVGHLLGRQQLDPAEQPLMLQLFIGKADQRFERSLIAQRMVARDVHHLGADEALA